MRKGYRPFPPVYVGDDHAIRMETGKRVRQGYRTTPKAGSSLVMKASTILEARPYVAGTLDENYVTFRVSICRQTVLMT